MWRVFVTACGGFYETSEETFTVAVGHPALEKCGFPRRTAAQAAALSSTPAVKML
jgi:hypothetical protein